MDPICENCPVLLDDNYGCTQPHRCELCAEAMAVELRFGVPLQVLARDWTDVSARLGAIRCTAG